MGHMWIHNRYLHSFALFLSPRWSAMHFITANLSHSSYIHIIRILSLLWSIQTAFIQQSIWFCLYFTPADNCSLHPQQKGISRCRDPCLWKITEHWDIQKRGGFVRMSQHQHSPGLMEKGEVVLWSCALMISKVLYFTVFACEEHYPVY